MKNLIRNITAKKQIILITGAAMLVVIIITVAASFSAYSSAAERDFESRMMLQMDYAVRNLDNKLGEYTSTIMTLYLNSSFQSGLTERPDELTYSDEQALIRQLRSVMSGVLSRYDYVPGMALYFSYGDKYLSIDRNGVTSVGDGNYGEWFDEVRLNSRRVICWSVEEDKNGGRLLSCAFRLKNGEGTSPLVLIRITQKLKYVLQNSQNAFNIESGTFCVLDGADMLYAEGAEKNAAELLTEINFSGESGSLRVSGKAGMRTIYWKKYDKLGWTLAYFTDGDMLERYRQALPVFMAVTVAVIVMAVGLLMFSSGLLTDRLVRLSGEVSRVSRERLVLEGDISGEDEVGMLAESFRNILEMARGLIEEKGRVEKEKYAIELQALQERINPHFLYNTISTISAMAQQIEAQDISDALYALADFYRLSLSHGSSLITLRDELKILSVYLDICRLRFGSNIRIEVDAQESCGDYLVPKLIIQPFIENAIMHGVDMAASDDNEIRVGVCLEDEELAIYITDNGDGMSEEQIRLAFMESPDGKQHAIKNVDRRIKLRYGCGYGVTIASAPGRGTQVKLLLPAVRSDGAG